MSLDIKTLIQEAYQTAKDHGWHDAERDFDFVIALIHSELSETLECYRDNHELSEVYYSCSAKTGCIRTHREQCDTCQYGKPEGIPVELADVCIRIFDTFGIMDVGEPSDEFYYTQVIGNAQSLAGLINTCHRMLDKALEHERDRRFRGSFLYSVIIEIRRFCEINTIDLEKSIELKMKYNKGREFRHGGKRV